MKVCYIADGSSVHTQRWLNYLANLIDEIHLICWKIAPGYDAKIKIHVLKSLVSNSWGIGLYLNFLHWCVQTRRLVKEIKPDILDAHFVTTYGFMAANSRFHPLVVTAWGSDILILPRHNPIYRLTVKYALKKADKVICTGQAIKEEITKLGVNTKNIQVIVLGGVNTEAFYPGSRDTTLMEELGIKADQPVLISTRNLAPVYDVATLIKAFPIVLSRFPNSRMMVLGGGSQETYIHTLAKRLGIFDRVFFTGWIKPAELPKYLRSADIYVSTSLSDGTSNSLLEAMATGIAAVVSDIPANRQWIREGENGSLFPVHDHIALAENIIKLLENPERRSTSGKKARYTVEKNANPDVEMQKLRELYTHLLIRQNI